MIAHGIDLNSEAIREFCRKWKINQLAMFGSVLRRDFRPDSDIDVLVTFAPEAHANVCDLIEMEKELKQIADSEMWRAGKVVRQLRPESQGK